MKGISIIIVICQIMSFLPACESKETKAQANNQAISSDSIEVKLELLTDAIDMPIGFIAAKDQTQRQFITDNIGVIRVFKKDSLLSEPFLDLRSRRDKNEKNSPAGYIFSMALHPEFASNGKIYVCYSNVSKIASNPAKLVIASFSASPVNADIADPLSEKVVMELEGKNIIANGAMIGFGPDGYLYISVGDDAIGDSSYVYHAQHLDHLNGKILRIDVNKEPYGIPADNPFVSDPASRPEVYAYGFRKMWRFCFDPLTRKMFGGDVGELKDEEIDIVEKGGNYGWPEMEGDSNFQKKDPAVNATYITPIHGYPRTVGICIIGGDFYAGSELPELKGQYLFSDFNGSLFALLADTTGRYKRQGIKIVNRPPQAFFITSSGVDENNEMVIMGFLVIEGKNKGVIYRVGKG
jgi:glucose/arabinose dehydrogenase